MAFEIRNDNTHQTSFYVLDIIDFLWKLEDASLEETWWCGITELDDNILTVHVYDNEDNPEQKSYFEIDLNGEEETNALENSTIISPLYYDKENEYFKEFEEFILADLNLQPELGCDYLEFNNNIIISTYVRSDNGFDCLLIVIDNDGEIKHFETLEKQLTGIIGKPFFIVSDKLFFIKNKSEICVYDLT